MKHLSWNCGLLVSIVVTASVPGWAEDLSMLSLAGDWAFRLDSERVGHRERWYRETFTDRITLPGSTDTNGYGTPSEAPCLNHLTRDFTYTGPAWYQKTVSIPERWSSKQIELFLERCHWETRVWVDGREAGMRDSLSVPHRYDLTEYLDPGEHQLTIRVDNRVKVNIGHTHGTVLWTHAITEETQTNWNGIIGRIELRAADLVRIHSIQAFPDFEKRRTRVVVTVGNDTRATAQGELSAQMGSAGATVEGVVLSVAPRATTTVEVSLPFGPNPRLWDEFSPEMVDLEVSVEANAGSLACHDHRKVRLGLREFRADGLRFLLNGRKVFLRGNLECAIFPQTAYPPMDVKTWRWLFETYQSYGINHVRFHSWCPPEAAFVAADELGLILQPENPLWDGYGLVGSDANRAAYILAEARRIIDTYGNHPSFCLMSMGNELGDGSDPYLTYLVDYLQKADARHLYTSTTHPADMARQDDFFVAAGSEQGVMRGLGPYVNGRPSTLNDFTTASTQFDRPVIAHEVGQPAMYPNFDEIDKYTGPLKAKNFEAFRKTLEEAGMMELADEFVLASGAQLVAIYKENIEAQLRSHDLDGFQLLSLQDFPGQGTALIGLLDAFNESKGLIAPEAFRRFCGPTVPLLRMENFVWTDQQAFTGTVEIAHYGPGDLTDQRADWSITNDAGKVLARGSLDAHDIATGGNTVLGEIASDLRTVPAPAALNIEVRLPGTPFANDWSIWVYPAETVVAIPDNIIVTHSWDDVTRKALAGGGRVLLTPKPGSLMHAEKARWHPVFWCRQLFASQPPTMGIVCDPDHPALSQFPTKHFADMQWFTLLEHSEALVVEPSPRNFLPVIQFVPDFNVNKKYSAVLAANVGKGRLIISTIDLKTDSSEHPESRQLMRSLLAYLDGDAFDAAPALPVEMIDAWLRAKRTPNYQAMPNDLGRAVLHVDASAKAPFGRPDAWSQEKDKILARDEGFDYQVRGETWLDGKSSAWHSGHLVVEVLCPPGFEGAFYAFFHDWDHKGREASLFFSGRDMGPLTRYDGPGVWLRFPVDASTAAEGRLSLDARLVKGPNVMISKIVLIPKSDK